MPRWLRSLQKAVGLAETGVFPFLSPSRVGGIAGLTGWVAGAAPSGRGEGRVIAPVLLPPLGVTLSFTFLSTCDAHTAPRGWWPRGPCVGLSTWCHGTGSTCPHGCLRVVCPGTGIVVIATRAAGRRWCERPGLCVPCSAAVGSSVAAEWSREAGGGGHCRGASLRCPFLPQRETLLRQLETNQLDIDATLEELSVQQETEDQNYGMYAPGRRRGVGRAQGRAGRTTPAAGSEFARQGQHRRHSRPVGRVTGSKHPSHFRGGGGGGGAQS